MRGVGVTHRNNVGVSGEWLVMQVVQTQVVQVVVVATDEGVAGTIIT